MWGGLLGADVAAGQLQLDVPYVPGKSMGPQLGDCLLGDCVLVTGLVLWLAGLRYQGQSQHPQGGSVGALIKKGGAAGCCKGRRYSEGQSPYVGSTCFFVTGFTLSVTWWSVLQARAMKLLVRDLQDDVQTNLCLIKQN